MNTVKRSIWILAGEASGDVYGAKLARELRRIVNTPTFLSLKEKRCEANWVLAMMIL